MLIHLANGATNSTKNSVKKDFKLRRQRTFTSKSTVKMDPLFQTCFQSEDFVNCLDFEDANAIDEEMMWLSSDLLNYQPLLNDCMLSEATDIPIAMTTCEFSAKRQTDHDRLVSCIKDQEFEQDLLTLVNPNMAMMLDSKDSDEYSMDESTSPETVIKEEPVYEEEPETQEYIVEEKVPAPSVSTVITSNLGSHSTYVLTYRPAKTSLLKPQTIALAPRIQAPVETKVNQGSLSGVQKVQIRLMPRSATTRTGSIVKASESIKGLPLSPPNSDSDGSASPVRSDKLSVTHTSLLHGTSPQRPKISNHSSLLSNSMPSSSVPFLSEEEERTLISEGYPVPTKWPLTKQEEKILKKIQRKIKNKVSAQESRRKKKDYIDNLEKRLEASNQENSSLKKKVEKLEHGNRVLVSQIEQLKRAMQSVSAQTSTYVMVFVLFFAVFVGVWSPLSFTSFSSSSSSVQPLSHQHLDKAFMVGLTPSGEQVVQEGSDYKTPSMKSRTLLSVHEEQDEDDVSSSMTCYGGMLSWLSMLHSESKAMHCEQTDNPSAESVAAAMFPETKEQSSITRSVVENQTEWKSREEHMPASVDIIYASDFVAVPVSES